MTRHIVNSGRGTFKGHVNVMILSVNKKIEKQKYISSLWPSGTRYILPGLQSSTSSENVQKKKQLHSNLFRDRVFTKDK